jgi:two-component sensor histidine kinase
MHHTKLRAPEYGALSNESGQVKIAWNVAGIDGARELHMRWTETGGPAVSPPTRQGFGMRLVVHGLKQDLGCDVKIDFHSTGVVCVIEAPLNATGFDNHVRFN